MATDPPGTTPAPDLLGTRVPGTDLPGTRPPSGGAEPHRLAPGGADLHRLRLVAITDRRRMVPQPVLTTGNWPTIAAAFAAAVERAVAGCPAGSIVVQVREKDLDGGPLLLLVRAAQRFAPVSVNDRLDVALAAGAWGVHLPERGLPLDIARAFATSDAAPPSSDLAIDAAQAAPRMLTLGVSRHAPPDDIDADLVQLGPIWPTPSKPGATPLGESALAWPHGHATLVAVGGIDSPDRAAAAAAAGADAVAIIRAAWTGDSLASFVAAVEAARAAR
jgi:thiamine-phosphate pyrophosphorylase